MLANKEEVREEESLLQNKKCHVITETDVIRLSREESDRIFLFTKRADLVSLAASTAGIPEDPLEDIIPELLGNASLPFPSMSVSFLEEPLRPPLRLPRFLHHPGIPGFCALPR